MNELQTFFLTFCLIAQTFHILRRLQNALDAQMVIKFESKEGLRFTGFWIEKKYRKCHSIPHSQSSL
jgi:hypothetical protein